MAQEYKPEWAKRLEEWGKKMERKYGGHSRSRRHPEPGEGTRTDSLDSSCGQNDGKKKWHDGRPQWQRQNNPIGEIIGNIISYFIITYAPVYFPFPGWLSGGANCYYSVYHSSRCGQYLYVHYSH